MVSYWSINNCDHSLGNLMNSIAISLAKSVAEKLNLSTLSKSFDAKFVTVASFDLKNISGVMVSVAAKDLSFERISRSQVQKQIRIDIGIQSKLRNIETEVSDLIFLAEQIAELFDGWANDDFNATCIKVEVEPIYSPEHIRQYKQFISVVTLTFNAYGL